MEFNATKTTCRHYHKRVVKKAADDILDRLNSFIDANQKKPTLWLTRLWKDQQNAITYKELREAILAGFISEATVEAWQHDYAKFVSDKMAPLWKNAMGAANEALTASHSGFYFDPTAEGVRNWVGTHGSEWVTRITDDQRDAINAMINQAYTGNWSVDELARAIRPTVGLTAPQVAANFNYYNHVKNSLLENNPTMREATAAKRAREAAAKYSAKQHRQRAHNVATTEMAFAYNNGADEGIRQAQDKGYIGRTKKVWSTAYDEGVCEICGALEGVTIDMDGEFEFNGKYLYSGQKQTPPAHPLCRCGVRYEEVEPPIYENAELTYDEESATTRYISSDAYKINEKLRNDRQLDPDDFRFVHNLDLALSKMPTYTGTLTRSLSFLSDDEMLSFLKEHEKGSIVEYKQYTSTTKGAIYNPDAPVHVIMLNTKNGRDISVYNQAEKEVIYQRDSRFKVKKVSDINGTIYITMEELT